MVGDSEIGEINSIRYRSNYYDNETELYYLQSRYYDSKIGRFISADSPEILWLVAILGDVLLVNIFSYCANNPIMNVDPTGY